MQTCITENNAWLAAAHETPLNMHISPATGQLAALIHICVTGLDAGPERRTWRTIS